MVFILSKESNRMKYTISKNFFGVNLPIWLQYAKMLTLSLMGNETVV